MGCEKQPSTNCTKTAVAIYSQNALPITKPTSPAPTAQSTNGTHASYGPFYLEYSLLVEFTLIAKKKLPSIYVQLLYHSALV
ncbi:AKT-interacting protein [Cricetulus griseus]|uniref:AKT-interacting protein n=1 Tax=Cricetulus griseus TaxID=10029 RepID=A0A061HUZ7_CRIGR|nr:AKT-interacting protein [Cricetulus griseus]